MIETISGSAEFDKNLPRERERKLIPVFPENLAAYREAAEPIEQLYLSHPSEPFSLRLREQADENGDVRYTAALKNRGELGEYGIDRLEIETEISPQTYMFYRSMDLPLLRKLRYEANRDVVIDFYQDRSVQLESEDPIAWANFVERNGSQFMDVTGDRTADNEWRSHLFYRQTHEGREALVPEAEFDVEACVNGLIDHFKHQPVTVARISGRSGSGKSTIVKSIQQRLNSYGIDSLVMSTDDYHRGATWLREHNGGEEWSAWDEPIVYDTETMAKDIERLLERETIRMRTIDFTTVEPTYGQSIVAAPIIIIEGIYAMADDFDQLATCDFPIATPLATCVGRRLLRDLKERPQFADPNESLRYMLEEAEPAWCKQ